MEGSPILYTPPPSSSSSSGAGGSTFAHLMDTPPPPHMVPQQQSHHLPVLGSSPMYPRHYPLQPQPPVVNENLSLRLMELTPEPPTPKTATQPTPTSRLHQTPDSKISSITSALTSSNGKRGRPRADVITNLILEGSSSPSEIKCKVCNRVFPREKSLQAHLRTHTGERPYVCDYPGCSRAFTQSGQLKTHQRLHAGEKPFVCSAQGCGNRYTHANRTCPVHPYHKPQRSTDLVLCGTTMNSTSENSEEVARWLENYRRERQEKQNGTPGKSSSSSSSSSRNRTKRTLATELEQENVQNAKPISTNTVSEMTPMATANLLLQQRPLPQTCATPPKRSLLEERLSSPIRKTLSDITPPSNSNNVLQPKKRWLREAFQEQMASGANPEVLARPIKWTAEEEEEATSPARSKSWMVAAAALVELQQGTEQPLNLSMSSGGSAGKIRH